MLRPGINSRQIMMNLQGIVEIAHVAPPGGEQVR